MEFVFEMMSWEREARERMPPGCTAFHRLCGDRYNPNHTVEYLAAQLQADPTLASQASGCNFPIHAAVTHPRLAISSLPILSLLLKYNPGAAFCESLDGYTAWEQYQKRSSGHEGYLLFLKAQHVLHERRKKPSPSTTAAVFYPLHTAASCGFRFKKIFPSILDRHKDNLSIKDHNGDLPLHIMLSSDSALGWDAEHVQMVLKAYPEAAAVADQDGTYPLELALECNSRSRISQECIVQMLEAAPQVTLLARTSPFWQLVKLQQQDHYRKGSEELTMMFLLLRSNPSQIQQVKIKAAPQPPVDKVAAGDVPVADDDVKVAAVENSTTVATIDDTQRDAPTSVAAAGITRKSDNDDREIKRCKQT